MWATLGRSAQALLPVIMRHVDERGMAYPGEGRLAAMAGLTRKTARQAASELEKRGLIEIRTRTSRQGRRCKSYRFKMLPGDEGILMPSIFIDGGNWHCLRPTSKSLAVALRLFAKPRPDLDPAFDDDLHNYGSWLDGDSEDWREYLEQRQFDFCNAEPGVLRDFSGIGSRTYSDALADLEEHSFIAPDPDRDDYWRVMVWPQYVQRVAYLNAKISGEGW